MRITEVTTEIIDPIGANTMAGNHIKVPSKGEGDNKIITEANTKVTADNLIPPVEAIIITIMAIIEAKVAMAMVETITDLRVMEEAIIEAIITTNTINTTCMMMDHRLNNMALHVHFAVVLIILLNIALKGHDINNLMENLSLGSSNQMRMVYINDGKHDNPHELPGKKT